MSAARITIERVLRDEDDASGQSVREWKLEAERGFVTIGPSLLLLRTADIDAFISDLQRAKDASASLDAPAEGKA